MTFDALKRSAVLPPGAFRLMLASAVVVSHASRFDVGRLAVLLFFYLSGYWVSRIYQSEFAGRRWLMFYVGRWLRITPLYFIAMLAAALALDGLRIATQTIRASTPLTTGTPAESRTETISTPSGPRP